MKSALIIFVKNPVLNSAKTIHDREAVAILRQLLLHTYNITLYCNADKFVFYSDFINEDDLWSNGKYQKYLQHGSSPVERMMHAFETVFEFGYKKVVLISSETIEAEAKHLNEAFDYLNDCDVTIGPAQDGSCYLLGMKKMHAPLFFSQTLNASLQPTLVHIAQLHLSYHVLPVLDDISESKDSYLFRHRQ